jgi:phosphate transport system substrate-binding protein
VVKRAARILVPLIAVSLALTVGCGGTAGDRLVLTGSSTVAPLASEIGKRFEASRPDVRIDVQTGGSSRGIADVLEGAADVGMVSRGLKDAEQELHGFAIARDGICLIAHEDNPVGSLTLEQVVGIYSGTIENWAEVGGLDAPITVVTKAEGRSTLELFVKHFSLRVSEIEADVVIGDNEQGIKTVAGNPHAVAYVSIGTAEYDAAHGVPIKLLALDGAVPSSKAVRAGSFPIVRPLTLVTQEAPAGLAKEFIDFARSEAVQDLVQAQYFVSVAR